jgi:glyoxylase-like metal-dependent hydrolase (beta-lactamase superfamily II)
VDSLPSSGCCASARPPTDGPFSEQINDVARNVRAMTTLKVGDVTIARIEEDYGPKFPVDMMIPSFTTDAVDKHGSDTFAQFMDHDTQLVLVSVHTWLVQTPRSTILIDTCNGNYKQRPGMPDMGNLETPWLDRLAAAGVKPEDVDYVICTHLHLDHVGWNTSLVNGQWVPTFPNAKYVFNRTEFEFWRPDNPASAPLEFNAGVFDDSVLPIFDRGLAELWDGDHEIDEVFHLETAPGHTPGNAVAWLESRGERVLFSGDTMHSAIQVYEPGWSSGFCVNGQESAATRRRLLDAAADKNAVLCPAHFSAPHAFRVVPRRDGFGVENAV